LDPKLFATVFSTIFLAELDPRVVRFAAGLGFIGVGIWVLLGRE
jgi:hypothetical protein